MRPACKMQLFTISHLHNPAHRMQELHPSGPGAVPSPSFTTFFVTSCSCTVVPLYLLFSLSYTNVYVSQNSIFCNGMPFSRKAFGFVNKVAEYYL